MPMMMLMTRKVLKVILDACGYAVLPAEDGVQALDFFTMYSGDVKAVMLDLIMPRKSCKDTYLALKAINPQVRSLSCPGLSTMPVSMSCSSSGLRGFLKSP